jgi:hypothetical protein
MRQGFRRDPSAQRAAVSPCAVYKKRNAPRALEGMFTFFNALQSHPAVVLYAFLYAKSTIPSAQRDLEGIL